MTCVATSSAVHSPDTADLLATATRQRWNSATFSALLLNGKKPTCMMFVNIFTNILYCCCKCFYFVYSSYNIFGLGRRLVVKVSTYLRQELVITSAQIQSVAVMANCNPLASVRESVLQSFGPSQLIPSRQTTIEC